MKDALGHGSNGSGDGTLQAELRARLTHVTSFKGGGIPQSSNKQAAASLLGSLQRTQAPVINAPRATWNGLSVERAENHGLVARVRARQKGM